LTDVSRVILKPDCTRLISTPTHCSFLDRSSDRA
jgi:hypothetical protein